MGSIFVFLSKYHLSSFILHLLGISGRMITSINHKSIGMNSLQAIGAKLTFMIIKHGTDPKLTF